MTVPFHVPITLPLSLGELARTGDPPAAVFPFDGVRSRYYYLARNAIWHGLDCLGLKPGDEILMPAYHHGVEVQTLLAKGMNLRYYRVDDSMRLDLEDLRGKLRPETRAIYLIHYLGFPQPVDEVASIAAGAGIPWIEDCALSLFSRGPSGPLGSRGDIGIFCLYKSLPVPHGGLLVLNRPDLPMPPEAKEPDRLSTMSYIANRILDSGIASRNVAWRGVSNALREMARAAKHASRSNVVLIDTQELDTSLMDVGVRGIARRIVRYTDARDVVAKRRSHYGRLAAALDPKVRPALGPLPEGTCPLSFPILVQDKPTMEARFRSVGIETVNMWSRHHPDVPVGVFPEVEFLRRHVLELPIHQGLHDPHIDYVAQKASELAGWQG